MTYDDTEMAKICKNINEVCASVAGFKDRLDARRARAYQRNAENADLRARLQNRREMNDELRAENTALREQRDALAAQLDRVKSKMLHLVNETSILLSEVCDP